MNKKFFNIELCKRFVSDNNLPIPILNDSEKFFYYVELYEDLYHSKTLWDNLCDEITIAYNGNVKEFLEDYYNVRDKMITDILENPKYQEFLKADMSQYSICEELKKISKGNVYNGDNLGKVFLSIDLKQANFQALRYFDKSIVKNEDTYGEYVSRYALESEYIQNSKYTRQVVFGKCNPARQITIEKHLMSKFYESLKFNIGYTDMFKLVRFNNDELVFEILDYDVLEHIDKYCLQNDIERAVKDASKESGVKVSYEIYRLKGVCLTSTKTGKDRNMNYILQNMTTFDSNWRYKFKEVPLTYHALVYKLVNSLEVEKNDYFFRYEGLDAYIDDDFIIKRFGDSKDLEYYNKENS